MDRQRLRPPRPRPRLLGVGNALPAAFFKRVGIDVATTLRAAAAISNLITKGARRELAPTAQADAAHLTADRPAPPPERRLLGWGAP